MWKNWGSEKRIQGYINKILIYLNKEISWNNSTGWPVGVCLKVGDGTLYDFHGYKSISVRWELNIIKRN